LNQFFGTLRFAFGKPLRSKSVRLLRSKSVGSAKQIFADSRILIGFLKMLAKSKSDRLIAFHAIVLCETVSEQVY